MPDINLDEIDWDKGEGLVPAIVQNTDNGQILMLAYMDRAALAQTISSKKVTFFSRSKNRLWTKGETSGNWLDFISGEMDCDADTLLIQARPQGPSCHTGSVTCFNDQTPSNIGFLDQLGALIADRHKTMPEGSYTTSLFAEGKARIAQKVGEEGVELALARMKDDSAEMASEAADLLFHMMVLLEDAGLSLGDAISVLQNRHK
ncbi:bifunctional phosphoribosyl-AMP cyclohydrolase/phosphoribosyl-ATP diphosphatase HisIE [Alphaproteobacteria bacterium]|jgi:phosphoribosyl-ATP pyrophosphohydrolase/phosphoribosyl-AMP cyclohydrolase|nr:bifunctional phosphoribosyl-AMP cyclohydrolase/phosphoribosyl-ATP diphosphatase HisIE [Alphaproteobacteria bacterium]MDA9055932.1 bifunctional phosphoribosyl-AMP cyclohydrolase/phosphoribosyl-ATP diphosphatase HisIE [Alphaproteobacteria bacterium]MDA9132481.1 bifunctional phosphoribosyl-AMP cyclohydrolase/phosphoribosyl-ATP diphosphatase HisIE [Alphaproteobacteria bacterium]MDB0014103.1 bifunctional phosphoribosyl-AMP cyclohydrolase/phosphoribosyl-ATP diphosphatase HisIE [Alphaproteobacteria 